MPHATMSPMQRAVQTANGWINDVAAQFDTTDLDFAYRVTRAWLHAVRDRLPVIEAAHLGAQLPELLRGVYYEGWQPASVPVKYDRDGLIERVATEARIAKVDVPKSLHAVSRALDHHLSGHLATVLHQFPEDMRDLLRPV